MKMKKKIKKEYSIWKSFSIKMMLSIVLFLLFLIGIKGIKGFNNFIYDKVYNNNISFAMINSWYKRTFGNIFPSNIVDDDVSVFDEHLVYNDISDYNDGALLSVNNDYLIPSLKDGIIVFIGNKEGYGNTVIVEDENKLRIWYSNINISNITIYDYVNKGDILGSAIDNKIYLIFEKEGKFEDYREYI